MRHVSHIQRITSLVLATVLVSTLGRGAEASTRRYRLSWRADPSTTMVVGWERSGGSGGSVYYGPVDHGTNYNLYPSVRGIDRQAMRFGMTHCFSRLSGLQSDTVYYFVIVDSNSTSARYSFRTAPDTPSNFSFVAGGDSRNNRTPRQRANGLVAKLRPLFVAFGGDYTDSNSTSQWQAWFDDWQRTIGTDGRMVPIVGARGNHDDNASLSDMLDWPTSSGYFALTFGGNQLRTYTLNSEVSAGGSQASWLSSDLSGAGQSVTFRVAQYHKPMRPHTSGKSNGNDEYNNWASTFYNNGMDLVVECDSHMVKRTYPIRPSTGSGSDEGFIRSDADGTTYIGEGCWGAPLRSANDSKNWTRGLASFNQVNWIHVRTDRMEVRTVRVDQSIGAAQVSDTNPLAIPAGLSIWSGTLTINSRGVPGNISPSADAGLDQTVTEAAGTGAQTVALDGRGSSDSDGTIASYVWTRAGSQIATGVNPSVSLAVGTHTLTLTVTDNDGATDSDTVSIEVQAAPISLPPLASFDFEAGAQGWTNPAGASYGWRRDSGGTPSNGTGPTTGNQSTWYWYMESSNNQGPYRAGDPSSTAVSSVIPDGTGRTLEFYYHMYGSTMGRLDVEVSTNGGTSWTSVWHTQGQVQSSQGAAYERATVGLSAFQGTMLLRFKGTSVASSSGYRSDMAVDDVTVYGNQVTNSAPVADAGADLAATDSDGNGSELLTLDGSASSDPDGSIVSYVWTEGGSQIAAGSPAGVSFSVGTHTVTLTVTDNDGATASDAVDIVVSPGSSGGGGTTNLLGRYQSGSSEGWSNPDGTYGWRLSSGGTPSRDTGPDNGQGNSGQYWYMETSSGQGPYTAADPDSVLVSPVLPSGTSRRLDFYYHMYGGSIGVLNLEASTNDGVSWTTLWTTSGQQHSGHSAAYTAASVDLSGFNGSLRVRFRGEAVASSSGWQNDIAVDSITLYGIAIPTVASFDFENGAQGWVNPDGSSYGWRRDAGGTPSRDTGPTVGSSGSHYLYMETSNGSGPIDTSQPDSVMMSPSIAGAPGRQLEFYYHMYGATMGILHAEISTDGGSTWTSVWHRSGQQTAAQSDPYTQATVDLSNYSGALRLRFRGEATASSNGWRGDMAVDDITVYGN